MSHILVCITATGVPFRAIYVVLVALFISISIAFTSEQSPSPQHQIMKPPGDKGAGVPQVVGGKEEDTEVWPATLKYYLDRRFSCTSTIIGDRVVITAAHCLAPRAKMQVHLNDGEEPFDLKCQAHPRYQRMGLHADVALCLSDRPFPTSFEFENLDLRITRLRQNSVVFLLGYGCRRFEDVGDPSKAGQLYGGFGSLYQLPRGTGDHILLKGDVVICPGDSGGAAYLLGADDKPGGPRSIVGINSGYVADDRISAFTSLAGPVAEFIRDWAADWNVTICGVHTGVANCRERYIP